MTPEQMDQLRLVNAEQNALPYNAIPGVGEPPDYTSDTPRAGWSWVCRMFTEAKATELKRLGWPDETLWTIICYTEHVTSPISDTPYSGRERHEVLEVRLPGETWILDSRFLDPYRWDQPPADYLWEGQQDNQNEFVDVSATGLTVLPA